MTVIETRLKNLESIALQYKRHKDFCVKAGLSASYWSQMRRKGPTRKTLGNQLARKLELSLGLTEGFLDIDHAPAGSTDSVPPEVMSAAFAIQAMPVATRKAFVQFVLSVAAAQPALKPGPSQ